jgi:hypothetical protein
MYQRASIYKRISLVLGITTLLLGLIPVPVLGQVGRVNADDGGIAEPQQKHRSLKHFPWKSLC